MKPKYKIGDVLKYIPAGGYYRLVVGFTEDNDGYLTKASIGLTFNFKPDTNAIYSRIYLERDYKFYFNINSKLTRLFYL